MGIMRALGLTNREVWSLAMMETFLMGLVAGLDGDTSRVYTGVGPDRYHQPALLWLVDEVIPVSSYIPASGAMAMAAAVLAGVFPAWRMSRMQAVEAIRYE